MPPKTGVDILVQIETGTPGTYTTLGGQRGATLNRTATTANANAKDTGAWDVHIATTRGWSVDCDALYLSDDAAYTALEDAWRNSTPVKVQIKDGTKTQSGDAYITDFPLEAPHDDLATISITLQGSGPLTAGA